ncbi:Armadillo repeat-containing protein 1 [Orchesella cincta]|uniref:Armadillo repeat-containing protein 1 n=1 Tax=Orchesella cincta TaxID=48709 RepID=A0A1D2MVV5_ORCCI|nr:Armadillo repeat-containing protein 1 [Orchesella cincta]
MSFNANPGLEVTSSTTDCDPGVPTNVCDVGSITKSGVIQLESTENETPRTELETDVAAEKLLCLNINESDEIKPEVGNESVGNNDAESEGSVIKSELVNQKLELIAMYMNVATNKKRHSYLLTEQTISGFLVLCLGDEDPRVVERSMEVFVVFGKHQENIPALQELKFFNDALRCVARNSEVQNSTKSEARKLVKKLLAIPQVPQPLGVLSDSARNIEAGTSNSIPGPSTGKKDANHHLEKPVDLNTTMSTMKRKNKGRETVLLVGNQVLQQRNDRAKITQVLINVPGIISVTYDVKNNHCIVRGKRNVPSEKFGQAVALLQIADVFIIRKNESGGVVKVPVPGDDQENTVQYPPYPEEVENEDIDDSRSVARKDQHNDDASFLKSAKNFLKRSFYW